MLIVWNLVNLIISSLFLLSGCYSTGKEGETRLLLERKLAQFQDRLTSILGTKGVRRNTFDGLNDCLNKFSHELSLREGYVRHLKEKVNKIWVTNQPQTIETDVRVLGNVNVKRNLMTNKIHITSTSKKPDEAIETIERELYFNSKEIDRIIDTVENQVVRRDRDNQIIRGSIQFIGPVTAKRAVIDTIQPSTLINGISLDELKTNVLRKSGNQRVTGRWKFESGIYVGDLHIKGLLSGKNVSSILLSNSLDAQIVTGHYTLQHGIFDSLTFGTINGIPREDLVLTSSKKIQNITGSKRFTNVYSSAQINLTGTLNGYNWYRLIRNSINVNKASAIPTTLRFDTVPTVHNLNVKSINNAPWDEAVVNVGKVELPGHKVFKTLSARKVILQGRINKLRFPEDFISLRSPNHIISPVTFLGNVTFASNLTVRLINGIDITRDAVLRQSSDPQIIYGPKVLDHEVSIINLRTNQTKLRHIDLNDLEPLLDGRSISKRSNVMYEGQLTINGSLQVNTINGININQLIDGLFSKSRDQLVTWPTKFNGHLTVGSAYAEKVNGLSIMNDLVRKDRPVNSEQVITGRKIFNQIVLGPGDLIMKGHTLNGVQLSSLEKQIIKNDPATRKECFGKKTFTSIKVLGNIIAESVNGLNLERDVMLADRPQTVSSRLYFVDNVQANEISFKNVHIDTMNGLNVADTLDRLVLYDQKAISLENKDFRGGLVADEIQIDGKINGISLANLTSSVVTLDSPQAIYSSLRFEDEVTFDHPIDARSINGNDLQKHFTRAVGMYGSELKVTGNVTVNGDLITGRLNHRSAEVLNNFIFHSKSDNQFNRHVIFNSTVDIDYLTVDEMARVDGVYLNDLIPLDKPIHLRELKIKGNARIDHQLIVKSGLINNCSLQDITMWTEYRNKSRDVYFKQPINFKEVNILGNLKYIGRLNGIDSARLSPQIHLQGLNRSLEVNGDVQIDELYISGRINGVDLQYIYQDSVKKTSEHQRIAGHKRFKSLKVKSGHVTFNGNVQVRGLIDGINVTKLQDDLVKPGEFNIIRGRKMFTSNETIFFNNIQTPLVGQVNLSDLTLGSSDEVIPMDTFFARPIVVDNLTTRSLHGRQLANDREKFVQFNDPVNVKHLIVKRINGIPIENFVIKGQSNHLRGAYTFNGRVYVHGDLNMSPTSQVNNINLTDLRSRSISTEAASFVPGRVELNGDVKFTRGFKVTDVNITDRDTELKFRKEFENITHEIEKSLHQSQLILNHQNAKLAYYSRSVDTSIKFHHFDVMDDFTEFDLGVRPIGKIAVSSHLLSIRRGALPSPRFGQSIYLWSIDHCAQKTFSFSIDGRGRLQERLVNSAGKHFPLTVYGTGNNSISISAWTNSSTADCLQTAYPMTKNLRYSYISLQRPVLKLSSGNATLQNEYYGFSKQAAFTDIKYFVDIKGRLYAVTMQNVSRPSQISSVTVYKFTFGSNYYTASGRHLIQQDFVPSVAVSMEISDSFVLNTTLLAISSMVNGCEHRPIIYTFKWDPSSEQFISLGYVQNANPTAMAFIESSESGKIYLVIANNSQTGLCALSYATDEPSIPMVNIYTIEGKIINSTVAQNLCLNINSVSSFKVDSQVYLVLSSKMAGKTYIYHLDKMKGFVSLQKYETKGVEDVKCFWASPEHLFMIATTSDKSKAILYRAFLSGIID